MGSTPLKVIDKREEANNAVSLFFEAPRAQWEEFDYRAGQFVTLEFEIGGKKVRRAYSLSSSPVEDDCLQITVKRIDGGLVSNHIHQSVSVGDCVNVLPPNGRFCVETSADAYKTYYLFGAGSGITPLFSILRTVLCSEPISSVFLLYGNRDESTIIFRQRLEELQRSCEGRLKVAHTLSRPSRENWSALWIWDEVDFEVRKGRIDEEAIRWFLEQNPPVAQDASYHICGPGAMIEATEQSLLRIGVPNYRIYTERFSTNPKKVPFADEPIVDDTTLVANVDGTPISCSVTKGKSLLQAMIDQGIEVPHSCETGVCGTCRAKLLLGSVQMQSTAALTKREIEADGILTCQARPTSAEVSVEI